MATLELDPQFFDEAMCHLARAIMVAHGIASLADATENAKANALDAMARMSVHLMDLSNDWPTEGHSLESALADYFRIAEIETQIVALTTGGQMFFSLQKARYGQLVEEMFTLRERLQKSKPISMRPWTPLEKKIQARLSQSEDNFTIAPWHARDDTIAATRERFPDFEINSVVIQKQSDCGPFPVDIRGIHVQRKQR